MNKGMFIGKIIYMDKVHFDYFNKYKCYIYCKFEVYDKRKRLTYLNIRVNDKLIKFIIINNVYILEGYFVNNDLYSFVLTNVFGFN